jgi:hypothetical protein
MSGAGSWAVPGQVRAVPEPKYGSSKMQYFSMSPKLSLILAYFTTTTTESKDNELPESSEREFRSLLLKIISDFKEDSNKQIRKLGNQSKT